MKGGCDTTSVWLPSFIFLQGLTDCKVYICSKSYSLLSFLESFELSTTQWLLVVICGLLWGMSKAGLKGVAMIAVPIMAFVFGSKPSTGIVLPMLIMADVLAVSYYNRHAQWSYLFKILPWTMLGVIFGVLVGK